MTAREEATCGVALTAAGGGAASRAVSGLSDEGDGEGLQPDLSAPRRGDGGFWLRDLNLRAAPGELVAVVGAVGSGKSSLLRALLGELPLRHGQLSLRGSIAYCAQRPFLVAGSARDNICFGTPYEPTRYAACRAAELSPHTRAHALARPCTPLLPRTPPYIPLQVRRRAARVCPRGGARGAALRRPNVPRSRRRAALRRAARARRARARRVRRRAGRPARRPAGVCIVYASYTHAM
jgi:energy-coupling factor transporter ATP-binding protein EcfA2